MADSPHVSTLVTLSGVLAASEHYAVTSLDRKSRSSLKQDVNLRAFVRSLLSTVYTTMAVRLAGTEEAARTLIDETRTSQDAAQKAEEASTPVA